MATKKAPPVVAKTSKSAPIAPPKMPPKKRAEKKTTKATASKKSAALSLDPKPPVQEPVIPHEEISLRAYFIAERRQKLGWPGDSATDWLDAVSQLRAEYIEKPLKKR